MIDDLALLWPLDNANIKYQSSNIKFLINNNNYNNSKNNGRLPKRCKMMNLPLSINSIDCDAKFLQGFSMNAFYEKVY